MNLKIILTIIAVLFGNFALSAQVAPKSDAPTQTLPKYTAKDYDDLAAKLKGGETNVDYKALRLAFTETKNYSYGGPDKEAQAKFTKPFAAKNYKDALKQAEDYLEKNYVDANAHFIAFASAAELKDDKKAAFHKTVLFGLLDSIKDGNDGRSAKTPFFVITIDEEYTYMRFLGYQHSTQSLRKAEGHTFDVFAATDTQTKENVTLYFNIDVVWAAETKMFSK